MKKRIKKAFTLVELLVVIAILAILATVSIVGYNSFTKKARVSNDTSLVSQLNTLLKADEMVNGKANTPTDALKITSEAGYDVEKLTPTANGYEIIWNQAKNEFALLDENKNVVYGEKNEETEEYKNWRFINEYNEATNYSVYLKGTSLTGKLAVNAGIDVGNNTGISSITYTNSANSKDVAFYTNGGKLVINDTNANSHQYHYGNSASVEVTTGNNCYEGHAVVGAMTINQGKAIASKGAYVGVVKASSGVKLEEKDGGVFVIPENAKASDIDSTVASQIGYTISGDTITPNSDKINKTYYVIKDYNDLVSFADNWNKGMITTAANVKFVENVEITLEESEAWTPIGNWEHPFYGTFDGNGCTIKGLIADATHSNYKRTFSANNVVGDGETYGFFGIVGNGSTNIKNLTLENVNIDLETGKNVGALVGYAPSSKKFYEDKTTSWAEDNKAGTYPLTIENVVTKGSVKGHNHVAGIIGKYYSTGDLTIKNCVNECSIECADCHTGGIVAILTSEGIVKQSVQFVDCQNKGTVVGTSGAVGGIAGAISLANEDNLVTFENCSNLGDVKIKTSNSAFASGIFASGLGNSKMLFKNCSNKGNITSAGVASGIFGGNNSNVKFVTFEGNINVSGTLTAGDNSSATGVGGARSTEYSRQNATFNVTATLKGAKTAKLWLETVNQQFDTAIND